MQLVTCMKRHRDKEVAGFYQRGKNRNYTKKYYVNRKPKYFATGTNDLAEAIKRFREFKQSPFIEVNNNFVQLVDRFIEYKIENVNYSENSIRWARSWLKDFGDYTKNIDPQLVKKDLISKYKINLSKRVSNTSIDIGLRAIKSFFSWCVNNNICATHPFKGIKIGSGFSSAKITYCTRKQRDLFYQKSPDDDMTFILFSGFDTGLRKNEIINARRDWFFINEEIPYMKVRNALTKDRLREGEKPFRIKNKKERIIPLTKKFTKFLKIYLKNLSPLDFALKPEVGYGKAIYRYDFRRPFNEFIKSTGEKDAEGRNITAHTMRHTFASLLLSHEKVSINDVAKYLGDSIKVTDEHYGHFIPGHNKTEHLHK